MSMNPLQIMQMMKNPNAFMQQMMNNSQIMQNPMARNVINMYQQGNTEGLKNMAENMAKEQGTTVDDVKSLILAQLGMK